MRPPQLLTFDLKGNLARAEWILDGWLNPTWSDVGTDTDNDWGDPVVVDAHVYMGFTYDYFFKRFGRKGLDDKDAPIRVIVHGLNREDAAVVSSDDYYIYLVNAFWCGSCGSDGRGYAFFGDGNRPGYYDRNSGQHFNYLAGALDAVAHELGHGLTSYTSRLIYRNESGALNEAFSDVMSAGAEFYYQAPGAGSMKADYLVGEDVVTPVVAGSPTGLRSLADPLSFGDPDHYSKRYLGTGDNGGVHTNGLIGGHAFYLAVEGGTNRTSQLSVQGVGAANREQIEKVFYRAFAYYLTSNATFSDARGATIRAAQELYGSGSGAERAITQAWSAVGVF
jgi:thermolysin